MSMAAVIADGTHRFLDRLEESTALRYALAPVCVAAAVLLHISVIGPVPVWSRSAPLIHPTGLFLAGIVAAAWFGGAGPGFLAAVLATFVLPLLIEMNYPLIAGFFDLPRFLAFGITGLAVGWGTTFRRRAEAALRLRELELRKARDELEVKVVERTAELRRSETLLAEAQKLSQTGSFGWNVSTGELFWSEETFRIAGYDLATRPTLERLFQRVHPDDIARVQEALDRGVKAGTALDFEHRFLMPNGSVKHVHVVAQAVRDEKSNLEYVGAVMDVTEHKQAEDTLHQSQDELAHVTRVMTMGELVASIAHEVNQPLGAIVTNGHACVRLLSREVPDLDKSRETVARMITDGMRASEVIRRIRDLLHKTPLEKAPVNINETIQEVIALVSSDVLRSKVELKADLADDLPPVTGDRIQLQQVILNLILNGKEAMSVVQLSPRELLITSRKNNSGGIVVAVRDSGLGLGPNDVERIFDPFFTTKAEGMGLGLSISRTIIESHGGTLWATRNVDQGATIQFALPPQRD
jgi:PAS domain S-box-containing protein